MRRLEYVPFRKMLQRQRRRRAIFRALKKIVLTVLLMMIALAVLLLLLKAIEPKEASAAVGEIPVETETQAQMVEVTTSEESTPCASQAPAAEPETTAAEVHEDPTVTEKSVSEPALEYLGTFTITHYCCEKRRHICGTGTGLTSSGVPVQPGMIATDPKVIPTGSTVSINGVEYTAYDTGGAIKGNRIDIAVDTHQHALELGMYEADVYLVIK